MDEAIGNIPDVDVIALSLLSGAHMTIFPRILNLMKDKGMNDVLLTGGGIIADDDIKKLMALGVGQLYGPGSSLLEAVEYIKNWYTKHSKN